jgi:hypothetical protein
MKAFLVTFAAAFAVALSLATGPTARQNSTDDSAGCGPLFECCDGTQSGNCDAHGGKCGLISICGVPN